MPKPVKITGLAVLLAAAAVLLTELLSVFHLLAFPAVAVCWLAIGITVCLRTKFSSIRPGIPEVIVSSILAIVAVTAVISPPNSADAMAYHLPRIVYWIQQGSVSFFPTTYLNQITLQPVSEYLWLQTYLLSGGDRFVNLVQSVAFALSVVGVGAIAATLGLGRRGQAVSAIFCATLPLGILQASGAKNELLLSLWLVAATLFTLRYRTSQSRVNLVLSGLSVGLALGTKGTGWLFAPPMIAACLLAPRQLLTLGVACVAGTVLINGPQFARNFALSGSVLGPDSAQGDGMYRWRNERLGWQATLSNALRHTSEQLGSRAVGWNDGVYDLVLKLHALSGIDPQDPGTTWPGTRFAPPSNQNHEASANNRWHLLLLLLALPAVRKPWLIYAAGVLGAFLLFCFYLKWQPFQGRMVLPLFLLAAPLAGALAERTRSAAAAIVLCLFLLSGTRLPLLHNWTRRWQGPASIFHADRNSMYFNDLDQWHFRDSYLRAVDLLAGSGCSLIGVDANQNHLEYPLQVLVLQRNPSMQFVHTSVSNGTERYPQPATGSPCAIFCPDCASVPGKREEYRSMGEPTVLDRILLFGVRP